MTLSLNEWHLPLYQGSKLTGNSKYFRVCVRVCVRERERERKRERERGLVDYVLKFCFINPKYLSLYDLENICIQGTIPYSLYQASDLLLHTPNKYI